MDRKVSPMVGPPPPPLRGFFFLNDSNGLSQLAGTDITSGI